MHLVYRMVSVVALTCAGWLYPLQGLNGQSNPSDVSPYSTPLGSAASSVGQGNDVSRPNDLTSEELAAMEFVRKHHLELVSLLELLRAMNPKQFEAAIKETNRVRLKLEQLATRDAIAHDIELESWKVQSKINLYVAKKITKNHDFENDSELKKLLESQRLLQIKQLQAEKNRIQKRLSQIDDQMKQASDSSNEWLQSQLTKLSRKASLQNSKTKKKPTTSNDSSDRN